MKGQILPQGLEGNGLIRVMDTILLIKWAVVMAVPVDIKTRYLCPGNL